MTATLPRTFVVALQGPPLPDEAKAFHDAVETRLQRAGWSVFRECPVRVPGVQRRGRIDLLAIRGGQGVAIECDRLTPRQKSLAKLRASTADHRVVLLRGGNYDGDAEGVAVLAMEVET